MSFFPPSVFFSFLLFKDFMWDSAVVVRGLDPNLFEPEGGDMWVFSFCRFPNLDKCEDCVRKANYPTKQPSHFALVNPIGSNSNNLASQFVYIYIYTQNKKQYYNPLFRSPVRWWSCFVWWMLVSSPLESEWLLKAGFDWIGQLQPPAAAQDACRLIGGPSSTCPTHSISQTSSACGRHLTVCAVCLYFNFLMKFSETLECCDWLYFNLDFWWCRHC